jgi:hypothetical protein
MSMRSRSKMGIVASRSAVRTPHPMVRPVPRALPDARPMQRQSEAVR